MELIAMKSLLREKKRKKETTLRKIVKGAQTEKKLYLCITQFFSNRQQKNIFP